MSLELSQFPDGLRSLIGRLQQLDRPASIAELREWLNDVSVSREDVSSFVRFQDQCYCRVPVVRSEQFELLCICWKSGQSSLIHDHVGSACGVRVVTGELTETIFEAVEPGYVRPRKVNRYRQGYVCSSVDRDIHQILNHQPAGCELITLHIYSPPLASMNSYSLLDESPLPAVAT